MKEFFQVLRRFVPPYKKYLTWSVIFNILSAILNIFSFATLIPILQILFKTSEAKVVRTLISWDSVHSFNDATNWFTNNANYCIQQFIANVGPANTLLVIGLL
ncbi:MAG: ABC transporter ATP-binding protein, partial [Prevotella sp.]|nr:ABC transporter ATP-binding protein [Prevotella sp.]